MSWVPLHIHSQFSILDSTASVKAIAKKAAEWKMPAVALTDSGNMFGIVEFYKACSAQKVKPLLGCELRMAPASRLEKKRIPGMPNSFPVVLLAMNTKGYQNLCKLSSIGFLEGFYYHPRIDREVLEKHSEGLICLSGSLFGPIAYFALQDTEDRFYEEIQWYQKIFQDRFYLELQRHPMEEELIRKDQMEKETWVVQKLYDYVEKQELLIRKLLSASEKFQIDVVATNDSHYIARDDWRAHEILINVQSGEPCEVWERDSQGNPKVRAPNPKRKIYSSHELYFKSPEEMQALFKDIPKALETTLKIADRCNCFLDFKTKHYPAYTPPHLEGKKLNKEERNQEVEAYLRMLCEKGIKKRYTRERLEKVGEKYPEKEPLQVVRDRLDYEFSIISSKEMCDYLLIVYDFINWAKNHNIPVGPGRGSAAGSIIAYLIGITDIEPLRFHLFFERFINPERISYPDIDVDICMERRSDVIDYTTQKYGKDRVAQIITFGTMKAKMAIKDVGRVLSVPLPKVNAIAKLVPEDPTMTLDRAFNLDPELRQCYETDAEAKQILDMARKAEGSIRNTSIHAAGMIISQDPITDHIPVCTAKDSEMIVTQYAMKPVEAVGMLKIDFLGLKTLTSIQKAVDAVARSGKRIDWSDLPLDDQPTFELLNRGLTLGVFQLESGGMQELAKQLHIDHFEEIIAVGALYRPGPMDMIPSFINRKHGRESIEIDHPLMKEILEETYGVMVYQEQVMQIASKLAGYSLGEGDVLRRAMGKKDREEMARQREKFLQGAKENAIEEAIAIRIFDKIEKFASYGFNKSHATAYAYLSYVTAYFKANYPKEWMAALMTCDRDDLSKVAKFIREGRSMGIAIKPPDVNEAGIEFSATKSGIRFAMSGLKGVGEGAVEAIVEERQKHGPFASLYDFVKRIDKRKVGKKNIEILIDAGCFDFTGWSRDAMQVSLEAMFEQALREQKEEAQGVLNLFSLIEDSNEKPFSARPQVSNKRSFLQLLQRERELLGFYLTGHPMDSYKDIINRLSCVPLKEVENSSADAFLRIAFIIEDVSFRISNRTQKKFAILTIGEGMERFELPIWPEMYAEKMDLLQENQLLYGIIQIDRREGLRLQCKYLENLTEMDEEKIKTCDDQFDRLQKSSRSMDNRKKTVKKVEPRKTLSLYLQADTLRLSQILELKQIFRQHPGNTGMQLHFASGEQLLGTVSVDSQWGVQCDKELGQKLRKLSFIQRMSLSQE